MTDHDEEIDAMYDEWMEACLTLLLTFGFVVVCFFGVFMGIFLAALFARWAF